MDKVTNTKTEFRLNQWTKIIQACQASGMTAANWCSQNSVKIKSYYYWLRRIRNLACESKSLVPQKMEQEIVPVSFRQSKASAAVTIHLSSISVDIYDGTSSETIETVLSTLKTYVR